MDRTSRFGIAVCLGVIVYVLFSTPAQKPHPATAPTPASGTATALTSTPASGSPGQPVNSTPATPPPAPVVEQLTFLENAAIKVTLSSVGASIKQVELKQHKEDKTRNVVLNEQSHENIMALAGWPGADTAQFQIKENLPDGVTYSTDLPGGIKWERTYTLGKNQDMGSGMGAYLKSLFQKLSEMVGRKAETQPLVYTLDVQDSLTNTGTTNVTLPTYSLSVGRAEPLLVAGHYQSISSQYLGSGWLTQKFHLTTISDFNASSFLFVVKTRDPRSIFSSIDVDPLPVRWLGVENQFYTVLLTPAADRTIQHAEFQCFNERDSSGNVPSTAEPDIEAAAWFPELSVPAGKTVSLGYVLYAGPKEFDRLNALGDQQGELMYYGMFELLIVPMLFVLHVFWVFVGNYGVAIILLTLVIKGITWPLQSFINRSGKRMQALAPKIKELQAKYKDVPEKLHSETFALYREYGVNPFAGCLPALIQMPIFFSLYFMLQNAVELRGQSFLWIHDLTQPDALASFNLPFYLPLFGTHLTINLLPVLVTGLTMVMMRITPQQISDPQQAKIAQFMPLFFLFIFYNFAAALSLYYVINNCVSIIQIYRNLKKPLPELKRTQKKKTA